MNEQIQYQERVLFVDDDANLLAGYQRHLNKRFCMDAALSGSEALTMLKMQGPYAVIVSDMRMPQMDGVQFLNKAKAMSPRSVRIMLTGNADQRTAMEAVNEGHIFRFLTKPCSPEILIKTLIAGIEQYRLVTAEAELLHKTLIGSVSVVIEMLSIADPRVFGSRIQIRDYVREIGSIVDMQNTWQLELAAMLAQTGQIAIPAEIKAKASAGTPLTLQEQTMWESVPEISRNVLLKIPRLEPVARIIFYQDKHYDGSGFPAEPIAGQDIPFESRILKILSDLVALRAGRASPATAFRVMHERKGWYDPDLLEKITVHFSPSKLNKEEQNPDSAAVVGTELELMAEKRAIERARLSKLQLESLNAGKSEVKLVGRPVDLHNLEIGDLLVSDAKHTDGTLLITKGNVLTPLLLARLENFSKTKPIQLPLYIVRA